MLLSIIVVTYNAENVIRNLLNSLAELDRFEDVECIFIDGASEDDTVKILKGFNSLKAKVISESDNGIYDAMNKGLNYANGDYLYFINSDDQIIYEGFNEILSFLRINNKQESLICCDVLIDGWGITWFGDSRKIPCHQGVFFPKSHVRYDPELKIYSDGKYIQENLKIFSKKHVPLTIARFSLGGISNSGYILSRAREMWALSKIRFTFLLLNYWTSMILGPRNLRRMIYFFKGIKRVS